jgi:hypothetical protein
MLEPDQGEIMVDVMIFLTNNFANGNHTPYSREQFHPSTLSITINCLFFASLSASLVAALASVVALQWVADYDAAITRGGSSPEDRAKRRQFRYAGVVWWRMSEIITALPLLLYCSVVVFLAGLIIWIWSLHYVVGWVVAGGTALAVLFYSVPMFLSIVFVSAPFRTPLGRWIYIISHFWFSTVYVLARALRIPSVAAWFERAHNTYAASRKREDREVDKRSELGMAALVWLANHLSISQDSYDRLLLLVGELPKLSVGKSSPVSLGDAPWFFIFDLLGWKNLKTDEDHSVSRQEIHSIRILAQLYQMPEVQDIIGPIHEFLYFSDESDEEYWLQYCDKKTSQWSPKARPNTPNSLFLLLRDIPLHSTGTDGEIQLVISLSRWRNSAHALPKPQENIQDNPSVSNPSTVVITDRFLREDMLHSWTSRDTEYLFFTIVQRIIGTVVDSSGEIQPTFLDRLRLYFEATILGNNFNSATTLCLSIPIVYRDLLRDTTVERVKVHHAFTLLLARNLKYYFGNEKVRKVKEVITMLWASPINRGDFETSHLAREFEMEKFFDANKKQMMTWVVNADEIGHIGEILEHLAVAQTSQPDIGPLWRVTASTADADPHFVEAMQAFEYIIRSGSDISPAIHRTLIDLLCRDIELGPLEVFTTSPTISGLASLSGWFIDPCLKFLAQYVERMGKRSFNTPRAEIGNPLEDSWARIATYLIEHDSGTDLWLVQLQASLWHALPDRGEAMCGRAFREPRTLVSRHHIIFF